jgi:hypothetical protein
MHRVGITLAFVVLLASVFAVAFICPLLAVKLLVNLARLACLFLGMAGAWFCLRLVMPAK